METEADLEGLKSRVISTEPENAVFVYVTRAEVPALNMTKLEKLKSIEETIQAACIHPY
jgi:hypothetical protein